MPPTSPPASTAEVLPVLQASLSFELRLSIGIHPNERASKQPVSLTLDVWFTPLHWPLRDLSATWDYDPVASLIRDLGKHDAPHIDLIESLLHRLAGAICGDPRVEMLAITVAKPSVFRSGGASVTLGPAMAKDYRTHFLDKEGA